MEVSSDRQITDLFQEIWDAESNDEDKTPPRNLRNSRFCACAVQIWPKTLIAEISL